MKRFVLVLSLVALLASGLVAQSSDSAPKFSVSFNPLGLLFFSFPFSVEYGITKDITLVADVFYSPNIVWVSNISVFDINAGARYYFGDLIPGNLPEWTRGPAPAGLFAGARFAYTNETWTYDSSTKGVYNSFGLGAEAGLKYFFKGHRGFFAEGTLGFMGYFPATWTWTVNGSSYTWTDSPSASYSPTGLTYTAKIGYSF